MDLSYITTTDNTHHVIRINEILNLNRFRYDLPACIDRISEIRPYTWFFIVFQSKEMSDNSFLSQVYSSMIGEDKYNQMHDFYTDLCPIVIKQLRAPNTKLAFLRQATVLAMSGNDTQKEFLINLFANVSLINVLIELNDNKLNCSYITSDCLISEWSRFLLYLPRWKGLLKETIAEAIYYDNLDIDNISEWAEKIIGRGFDDDKESWLIWARLLHNIFQLKTRFYPFMYGTIGIIVVFLIDFIIDLIITWGGRIRYVYRGTEVHGCLGIFRLLFVGYWFYALWLILLNIFYIIYYSIVINTNKNFAISTLISTLLLLIVYISSYIIQSLKTT